MKLVKKFLLAALFVSALSVSTYAGDMETPGYAPPPPDRSTYTCTDETTETSSTSTEIAADLSDTLIYDGLMTVMSLF